MRLAILIVLAHTLSSCTLHVHVHESPRTSEGPDSRSERAVQSVLRGIVVDSAGRPVAARIAAVGESGSISKGTNSSGQFEFDLSEARWATALHASTEDGRIAVAAIRRGDDAKLVLAPGSKLVLDLAGRPSARCAVFSRDLRVEDFTLHSGTTSTVVVPFGAVHVRVYDGETVLAEGRIEFATGESKSMSFTVGG